MAIKTKILVITLIMALFMCIISPVAGVKVDLPVGGTSIRPNGVPGNQGDMLMLEKNMQELKKSNQTVIVVTTCDSDVVVKDKGTSIYVDPQGRIKITSEKK